MTKTVFVSDGPETSTIYDSILSHVAESGDYIVRNEGENMLGEGRINVTRRDLKFKMIVFEGFGDEYPEGTLVRITVPSGTFEESSEVDSSAALEALIETTKEVYEEIEVPKKAAYGIEDHQPMIAPVSKDDLPPSKRRFLTWLDIFSPAEVEALGREDLLTAPAHLVESLNDGSIVIVSKHPTRTDPAPLDRVANHVGIQSWEDYPDKRASRSNFDE